MTTRNKQAATILAQKSVAVLSFEGQNTKSFEKVWMLTAGISFTQKILWAELVLCSTLHLFDLQIIFITMPQEARKGKSWGGTNMWASKRTLWVFTACKQMKNRGIECAFILVVVRPTVVQGSFHTEFLSSIRFSPLRALCLLRRRKRTRNFLASSSCVFG